MRGRAFTKLRHNLIVVIALVSTVLFGLANVDQIATRASVPMSALELAAAHDCWSGEAPKDMVGRMPGHVVVTLDGDPRYAGPPMVARALDQVFAGVDHGLTVHMFCR